MTEFDAKVLDLVKAGVTHSIGITVRLIDAPVTHAHDFFPASRKVLKSLARLHKAGRIDVSGPEILIGELEPEPRR